MKGITLLYFLKILHPGWLNFLLAIVCLLASFVEVTGQTIINPSADPAYDISKAASVVTPVAPKGKLPKNQAATSQAVVNSIAAAVNSCYFAPDLEFANFPGNDDGSVAFTLPFNFNLYGTMYTSGWINNNGNITFTGAYGSFTAMGFPFSVPMVAPFWADADTRGAGSGTVHFKINPTSMVVSWDNVGYYSRGADKLNSYSAIITNGTDPLIGIGNNVAFYYGDMQWTTGVASGGVGGFGGTPATIGINKGDNLNYLQVGRFGLAGNNYDGPGGNIDGIDYMDYKCFTFNTSGITNQVPSVSGVPAANTLYLTCGETKTLNLSFITSVGQSLTTTVSTGGLCGTSIPQVIDGNPSTALVAITGSLCNQGTQVISFTATDNNVIPLSTTVNITVIVTGCCTVTATAKNATVFLDAAGNALLLDSLVNNASTATCGIASVTVAPAIFSCANLGANNVLLTVTDSSGNSSSSSAVITVKDSLLPLVNTQPISVMLDAKGNGTITAASINNKSADNCGILSMAINKTSFNYTDVGENTVTLTVKDSSGNMASNTAIVTVMAKGLDANGKLVPDATTQTNQYGQKNTGVGKTQYGQVFGSPATVTPK